MSAAYIIKNKEIIASVETDAKNGELVFYAYLKSKNEVNKSRSVELVNAKIGKISRAKRYFIKSKTSDISIGIRVNADSDGTQEFLI